LKNKGQKYTKKEKADFKQKLKTKEKRSVQLEKNKMKREQVEKKYEDLNTQLKAMEKYFSEESDKE
jgi:hypothetical protein